MFVLFSSLTKQISTYLYTNTHNYHHYHKSLINQKKKLLLLYKQTMDQLVKDFRKGIIIIISLHLLQCMIFVQYFIHKLNVYKKLCIIFITGRYKM